MAALTTEQVKHVASLPWYASQKQLAKYLGLEFHNEHSNLGMSIHLDCLHHSFLLATNKGFTWEQVSYVLVIAERLLKEAKGKISDDGCLQSAQLELEKLRERPLADFLQYFHDISKTLAAALGDRNFKHYIDFLSQTFLQHYSLYQYVMTNKQASYRPVWSMDVEVPPEPLPLNGAIMAHLWEYEQKYKKIDDEQVAQRAIRNDTKRISWQEQQQKAEQSLQIIETIETPFNESMTELLKSIIKTQCEATSKDLRPLIQEVREELDFMLQKNTLPRPEELGPPPYHETKPPKASPSNYSPQIHKKSKQTSGNIKSAKNKK